MNDQWKNETVYKKDIVAWIDAILAHEEKIWESEKLVLVTVKNHIIDMKPTNAHKNEV